MRFIGPRGRVVAEHTREKFRFRRCDTRLRARVAARGLLRSAFRVAKCGKKTARSLVRVPERDDTDPCGA